MVIIKNLFPFTKSYNIKGTEILFKAFEEKEVSDDFINPDRTPKFPGTEVIKRMDEAGNYKRNYIRHEKKYVNPRQEFLYVFENEKGEKFRIINVQYFCRDNNLNDKSIRNYVKWGKKYKGWNISREPMTEEEVTKFKEEINND